MMYPITVGQGAAGYLRWSFTPSYASSPLGMIAHQEGDEDEALLDGLFAVAERRSNRVVELSANRFADLLEMSHLEVM